MKTSNCPRTFGRLLAACSFLVCTPVVQAQAPAPAPPTNNAAPVKVVPRVERGISLATLVGIKPGSVHKIGVGLGVARFRTIKVGPGGWISVECEEENKAGWIRGEKYWINTNNVVFISAPFVSNSVPPVGPPAKAKPKAR